MLSVAVAALLAIPFVADAQTPNPVVVPPSATLQSVNPATISVEFPGGTISQLIAAIAKGQSGPMNIIGEQKDLATVLPPFSVQNAHPQLFAQALNQLLEAHGLVLTGGAPTSGTREVYTLRRNPGMNRYLSAFASIQLAPFLEHQTVDDIVQAIHLAWELDPTHDSNSIRLKFHPATTILLISGPQEAIEIANQVVMGTLRRATEEKTKGNAKSGTTSSSPAAEKR